MTIGPDFWVGVDENQGVPSLDRPDKARSAWSWEAIAAVERPYNPVVSPDGALVVYTLGRDTSDIWVVSVAGGLPTRVTTNRPPMPYWEDTPASWSANGRRLAYRSEGWIWVIPTGGGEARRLVQASTPKWLDDQRLVVRVERDDEDRIAILDVDDPWPQVLTPPGHSTGGMRVAGDGSVLYVRYPRDDLNASEIWRIDPGDKPMRLTGVPGMQDRHPALSPDGSTLAFTSERSGWYEIHLLDLDSGEENQLTSDRADFSGLDWHHAGKTLLASRARRGRLDLVIVSVADGDISVVGRGGDWSGGSWAIDDIVALHEDHRTPARLVRLAPDGAVTDLTSPPPTEVTGAPHVSPEDVVFASFDGTEIHGLLFRPPDTSSPVPAVVYPHGGPTSAYTDSWDGHAQYLVDKGYAWLAINFRGSTTYGRDFERANHGVWGVDDTRDCLAAADFLKTLDWVDGDRLAIFGASYGSYMALAALAYDPEHRFACGVAKYGDSDIATSWAQGDRGGREDLERMMSTPARSRPAYRAGSPLWSVSAIESPLLIAHGEQDVRVHPDQSRQLVDELRRLGKSFEYVTYPTEAHGLLRTGPQVHFYRRLERFLDWHLM